MGGGNRPHGHLPVRFAVLSSAVSDAGHLDGGLHDVREHGLALQFGQREVVGNLSEHLRQRGSKGGADGGEQLRRGFLLAALNLG